jgi:hypothetical protein
MLPAILVDARFRRLLLRCDEDLAEEVRRQGCRDHEGRNGRGSNGKGPIRKGRRARRIPGAAKGRGGTGARVARPFPRLRDRGEPGLGFVRAPNPDFRQIRPVADDTERAFAARASRVRCSD